MEKFDSRYGNIISPEKYGCPHTSLLFGLKREDQLLYSLIDAMLANGTSLKEIPDPYSTYYYEKIFREESLIVEWRNIQSTFKANGIIHTPLKGLWLKEKFSAQTQYIGDFDILLRPKKMRIAKRLLLSMGYKEVNGWHNYIHFHQAFWNPKINLFIELHSELSYNDFLHIPLKELWIRSKALDSYSMEFSVLDQAVYILYHTGLHFFDRPSRILDVHKIMQWSKDKISVREIIDQSEKWKCARMVALALIAYDQFSSSSFSNTVSPQHLLGAQRAFDQINSKEIQGRSLRRHLSDSPWDFVRGALHPRRIIGSLFDRLEINT